MLEKSSFMISKSLTLGKERLLGQLLAYRETTPFDLEGCCHVPIRKDVGFVPMKADAK